MKKLKVWPLLRCGEENKLSSKELARLAGFSTSRALQAQIAAERSAGALILSSSAGGYFRPAPGEQGKRELAAFEATLRRRAISTLAALHATRAALAQVEGQQMLDDTPSGTRGGEDGVQS